LGLVLLQVLSQNRDGFPIELFYFRNIATFPQNEVAVLLKLLWGCQGFLIAFLSLGDIKDVLELHRCLQIVFVLQLELSQLFSRKHIAFIDL
jgi:hypothetical protein